MMWRKGGASRLLGWEGAHVHSGRIRIGLGAENSTARGGVGYLCEYLTGEILLLVDELELVACLVLGDHEVEDLVDVVELRVVVVAVVDAHQGSDDARSRGSACRPWSSSST